MKTMLPKSERGDGGLEPAEGVGVVKRVRT